MKNTLTIIAAIFIILPAFAQIKQNNSEFYGGKHEIRFSMGDPLFHRTKIKGAYNAAKFSNFFESPQFVNNVSTSLPITVGYRYHLLNWLWLGGDVTYCGFYGAKGNYPASAPNYFDRANYLGLSFSVRFSYLNREHVTLYSEIGANLISMNKNINYIPGEITLFGFNAGGKHWFGSAEIGYGSKGFINAGFGYRFY